MYKKLLIGIAIVFFLTLTAFGVAQAVKPSLDNSCPFDEAENISVNAEDKTDLPFLYFNSNTGSGKMLNVVINQGDNLPTNSYVKEGYKFVGWSEKADGSIRYANEEVYLALESGAINTLYAIWTKSVENLWVTSSPLFQEIWGEFLGENIHRNIKLVLAEEFVFAGHLTINATGKVLIYANEIPLAFECDIKNIDEYLVLLNIGSESDGITYSQYKNSNIIVGNYFSIDKILANDCLLENGAYISSDRKTLIRYVGTPETPEIQYTIPPTITDIGMYAFVGSSLSTITTAPGSQLENIGYGAFRDCSQLTVLSLSDSVSSISSYSFSGSNIYSFDIPANLKSIGEFAFNDCTSLTSVEIPAGITYIDYKAFYGCTGLQNISVASGNTAYKSFNGVLFNIDQTELVLYPAGKLADTFTIPNETTIIADYAFANALNLDSIIVTSGVTKTGLYAFNDIHAEILFATDIELNSIGDYSFSGYRGTSITLPASVKSIGNHAFENSNWLTAITLSTNISSIGEAAFAGCTNLIEVVLPDNLESIGAYAFSDTIANLIFSENSSMTTLDDYSLAGYKGDGFTIPKNIDSLGIFVFSDSTATITFAENSHISSIGKFAFSGYNGTSVTLPANITEIGFGAFYNAINMSAIIIPSRLTELSDYIFANCSKLTAIEIPLNIELIGEAAFSGCTSLLEISLPYNTTSIGAYAFRGIQALIIFSGNPDFKVIGDGTFSGYKGTNIDIPVTVTRLGKRSFENCTNFTLITIPESVKFIGMRAFEKCTNLISVNLPSKINAISEGAFENCKNLSSISIPDNVKSIDPSAFSMCKNLTSISFGENSELSNIGNWAFLGCNKLSSFTIPQKVNNLGYLAFYGCNALTEITIHANVMDIGYLTFYGCNNLQNIYLESATPPTLGSSALSYNATGRKIHVPMGSLLTYRNSKDWSYYASNIYENESE